METKFYIEELAEKQVAAMRLAEKSGRTRVEDIELQQINVEISVINGSLLGAQKKYRSAFENIRQNSCKKQ